MTRSPRSRSPLPKVNNNLDGSAEGARFSSPLRQEQKLSDASVSEARNGTIIKPVINGTPKLHRVATEPPEFPFLDHTYAASNPTKELISNSDPGVNKSVGTSNLENITNGDLDLVLEHPARTKSGEAGCITPTGRRSVQFARSTTFESGPSHSRNQSVEEEDAQNVGKDKGSQSIFTKLKALAVPAMSSHGRSSSAYNVGESAKQEDSTPYTPISDRFRPKIAIPESEDDADAEESASEATPGPAQYRKRKRHRRADGGTQTAPTTPKMSSHSFSHDSPTATSSSYRPGLLFRRATMTDIPENQRQGVSEDEGRERLRESAWKRGIHGARGLSYSMGLGHRHDSQESTNESRRPSHLRRFTGIGDLSAAKGRTERSTSISALRWERIKNGLKLLGRQKQASRLDNAKSAELMAELLAGAPAALFLASMFQRDENGHRRIPILLEQLKVSITDSQTNETKSGDRHLLFRIELEYGSGITRMKWVVHRTLVDFAKLHMKYKLQGQTEKYTQLKSEDTRRVKLPRFPRGAFPYLRGMRGLIESEDEDDEPILAEATDGDASGTDRPRRNPRRRSSHAFARRKSSISSPVALTHDMRQGSTTGASVLDPAAKKENYAERQRKKLEVYLRALISFSRFRADSNRLCKFLELSALGVRLAGEGGYHGKEGNLHITSGKGMDFRKRLTPYNFKHRHESKWFMVRNSYIVCIDSPEAMNIYDVFLVDSDWKLEAKKRLRDTRGKDLAKTAKESATRPQRHTLRLYNSERKVKLWAKHERLQHQFEESINFMVDNTIWSKKHRFDSFAPVRHGVFAQWLVDGRDYMWNVSRAISMAKDVIYIHDWWLSPELYLRRPAAISQKWRLDRLLQRKAREGVKVFVIMYRNINTAIPIDSTYSKFSLLDLHPNVFVQRSPNQFRQNTFFWAHHEKLCIVDHTVAFCGGVDLCFGRWDTPQHSLIDDKLTGFELNDMPKDSEHCQSWPGKDYSNPRIQDFYALDRPYEEMYDRTKVPRMPWHDIAMQIVGQPARDLTRHFVQRWNYILRQRTPSRPTPFLLPAPDFLQADLEALQLDGTCEIQMLRSASAWSIGTPDKVECSIMNAYTKCIQTSDHFVYIENQFFISSCNVEDTQIINTIGDALVERIIRAHENGEDWRAIIVIPLMPGFQNTVDSQDGSSVRLIMTCQYRSICRGETSIFGRLRAANIEPEDYIQFYSLRSWGRIGPNKAFTTEQLYIHAKCMVVDDRVAIIGSANINERSMLGSRDSEVAAIVRDREMIESYMGGEKYLVGKFPHTLRMRLMREHLGVNVDEIEEQEHREQFEAEMDRFHDDSDARSTQSDAATQEQLIKNRHRLQEDLINRQDELRSFNHDVDWEQENNPHLMTTKKLTVDSRINGNEAHHKDVEGRGPDHMLDFEQSGEALGRDSTVDTFGREVLISHTASEGKGTIESPKKGSSQSRTRAHTITKESINSASTEGNHGLPPLPLPRMDTRELGLTQLSQLPPLPHVDDTDIGGPPLTRRFSALSHEIIHPLIAEMKKPVVTPNCMKDPLSESFVIDTWHQVAENNTKLFRNVFRCQPDNEVQTWKEYKEYVVFQERFSESQFGIKSTTHRAQDAPGQTGPPGTGIGKIEKVIGRAGQPIEIIGEKLMEKVGSRSNEQNHPMGTVEEWTQEQIQDEKQANDEKAALRNEDKERSNNSLDSAQVDGAASSSLGRERTVTYSEGTHDPTGSVNRQGTLTGSQRRRRRATTKSSTRAFHANDPSAILDPEACSELMDLVQGHLVVFPYDWLAKEESGGRWFYTVDQIAPLEI
ncbi:phospholipase D [Patellaria atrata CBS 101060]|uniref:Phospholipase n=1 Tax=Patellaria atrata CBS 101060 TaxID=1346257 RepID=A0A9P4VQJ6_9PEZI|nr:phospholipase D [Patellaria atrata CBS 101060]